MYIYMWVVLLLLDDISGVKFSLKSNSLSVMLRFIALTSNAMCAGEMSDSHSFEIDRFWLICDTVVFVYVHVEKVISSFLIIIIIAVPMAAPISLRCERDRDNDGDRTKDEAVLIKWRKKIEIRSIEFVESVDLSMNNNIQQRSPPAMHQAKSECLRQQRCEMKIFSWSKLGIHNAYNLIYLACILHRHTRHIFFLIRSGHTFNICGFSNACWFSCCSHLKSFAQACAPSLYTAVGFASVQTLFTILDIIWRDSFS